MLSADLLHGLQAFVMTADAGSFTVAAERLSLTRSAIGKAVGRLERRLGTRLFHRTTRSLGLTDEGRTFYASAVRALGELEKGEAALAARKGVPSGRVRIDLPVSFGQRWVMPVLLELAERHRTLRFDVSFSNRKTDFARDGIDLKVRVGALGDNVDPITRYLGRQETVVCATPHYLDRRGRPQTVADLAEHDAIVDRRSGAAWAFTAPDGTEPSAAMRARWRLDRAEAITEAVLSGQGLARLPTWLVAEHLASGALEAVLPGYAGRGLPIHAMWLGPASLKVRTVVDALVQRFLPNAPWER